MVSSPIFMNMISRTRRELKQVEMAMKKRRASWLACFLVCLFMLVVQKCFTPLYQELKVESETIVSPELRRRPPSKSPISCDRTNLRYDLCKINGPTVLDPTTATFHVIGPKGPTIIEKIRPYPRKYEEFIMGKIRDVTIKASGPPGPKCEAHHNSPALVFSAGGYTGNFFHDFNDGFIPLFITVNTVFNGRDRDKDIVIVVSESPNWWAQRYAGLLGTFSAHPIITLRNDTATTHCFTNATLGLIAHGFMTINKTLLPNSKTMLDFRAHLEAAFGRERRLAWGGGPRPRLLLASRGRGVGRRILNQGRVVGMMEEMGFEVLVFEPRAEMLFEDTYALINSSHAMVGVHGAALTHSVFLRPGSVLLQIVPIGVNWAAEAFFGRVGQDMNLEYMEYKIEAEESSLVDKYGKDSMLVKSPYDVQNKGWPTDVMDIYLKEQEVTLNLKRFGVYLKKAYKKAKRFMDNQG